MNTPTIHSLLRWCWTRRFPVLFTAVVTGLLMPSFSASPPGSSRKVTDLRTGKSVETVLANGTIYQFQATVPKVNLWQVPVPLEGVWMESEDKGTLTWISSLSGLSGDSTDCGGTTGGGAGDCPPSSNLCNGIEYQYPEECCNNAQVYDPNFDICCGGAVHVKTSGCCVDDVWYANGTTIGDCTNCVDATPTFDPCAGACDTNPPSITCPTGRTFCVGDTIPAPTSTDDCGAPGTSPGDTNFIVCGTHSVLWTVTDNNANTNACTESLTVVGVASLTPDEGIDIGGRTNIVCWETNGHVTVTAVSCPELTAEQLPACWIYTGGEEVDKLTHRLAKDTASAPVEFKVTAGTSTTNLWVAVVKVDLSFMGLAEDRNSAPPNEEDPGAFLCINENDDNDDNIIDWQETILPRPASHPDVDLVEISLNIEPSTLGRGTATLSVPSHLKVWKDNLKNETPLEWDLTSDTLPGSLYVECIAAGIGDITLTWQEEDATCSDKVKVSVIKVNLTTTDVLTGQDLPEGPSEEANEDDPGAVVVLNDDDDDSNGQPDKDDSSTGAGGDDDLVEVKLAIYPSGLDTNIVTLVVPSHLKVWADNQKTPLPNPPQWDLAQTDLPSSVYMEGISIGEDDLTLKWAEGGECRSDNILVNVIKPDLSVEGVADENEESIGGILCVNCEDDDLKELTVDLQKPSGFDYGSVVLEWSSTKIKLYEDNERTSEVSTGASFDASDLPTTLYLEGVEASDGVRDVAITLTYTNRPTWKDVVSNTVYNIDVRVDTDRDGTIDEADEEGEDQWTLTRGALLPPRFINFRFPGAPPAINSLEGLPKLVIPTAGPTNLPGCTLRLKKTGDPDPQFPLLGLLDGSGEALWFDSNNQYTLASAAATGAVFHVAVGEARKTLPSGVPTEFTVELQLVETGGTVLCSNKVRIAVAPLILPSECNAAQQIYSVVNTGISGVEILATGGHAWIQDQVKFTKVQFEEGGVEDVFVTLGHSSPGTLATILRDDEEIPGLSWSVGGDGGNIMATPPYPPNAPYGALVIGTHNTSSQSKWNGQNVQPVINVDTTWLRVGHVDEVLMFIGGSTVLFADPWKAADLLHGEIASGNEDNTIWWGLVHSSSREKTIADVVIAKTSGGNPKLSTLPDDLPNSTSSVDLDFPNHPFEEEDYLRVDNEVLKVENVNGSTVTLSRAHAGRSAAAHSSGAVIYAYSTVMQRNLPVGNNPDDSVIAKMVSVTNALQQGVANYGGSISFVAMPVLFDLASGTSKYAANSANVVNCVVAGGTVHYQSTGIATFEDYITDEVSGSQAVDLWDSLHTGMGEIHCGTAVNRSLGVTTPWWELVPSNW